jgi:signal transduction histidine kinase
VLTGVWVAVGLGAVGWFVANVATQQIETAFDARLDTLLDALVAATTRDGDGHVSVARVPTGADFERPLSGAYWQVTGPGDQLIASRSLWDETLPAAVAGHAGILRRDATGPRDQPLRIVERDVVLPGSDEAFHLAVALSRVGTEAEVARLRQILVLAFGLLGAGLVGGVVVQVVLGLTPLRRTRRALSDVRNGIRDRLEVEAPSEIAPLVSEINALIAQNRTTVERARAHVGNLAHALKTPLAVLQNALEQAQPDIAAARTEARTLDRLVQHHLARARTAAITATVAGSQVAPLSIAEDVAAALRQLFASRDIVIDVSGTPNIKLRVDPQDLTEMLGNLMENACKWARSAVVVTITADPMSVTITVEDDGPGIPLGGEAAALARGGRLDEAAQGSGLGLAIVADLAALHSGRLALRPRSGGGLLAELHLPHGPMVKAVKLR